jgi:2-oxo-3-hexenedioate decarboxylase
MNDERVELLARGLLRAWDEASLVPLPSADSAGLTQEEAYAVGGRLRALRVARGERPVGWKIGFTNRSLWSRYGVDRPMWAPVWDTTVHMWAGGEGRLSMKGLSQPRIEPEVAFGFRSAPQAGMSLDALQDCIDWTAHAFEIVHTHFDGWRFTAADTAADFALHGALFVGPGVPVRDWLALDNDLTALRIELLCNGEVKDRGEGRIVLDGPLRALKVLVDSMATVTPHWRVAAGEVVSTGTITDAWPLAAGQRWSTSLAAPSGDARLSPLALQVED